MLHFTTSPGMGQGFRLTAFRKTSRERPSLYKDVEKGSAGKSLLCMLGIREFLDRSLWCQCCCASESFYREVSVVQAVHPRVSGQKSLMFMLLCIRELPCIT